MGTPAETIPAIGSEPILGELASSQAEQAQRGMRRTDSTELARDPCISDVERLKEIAK
jgi:hypothetical protein